MSEGLAVLLALFVVLMLLDTPIAFVIGLATVAAAWTLGYGDNRLRGFGRACNAQLRDARPLIFWLTAERRSCRD